MIILGKVIKHIKESNSWLKKKTLAFDFQMNHCGMFGTLNNGSVGK